MANAHEPARDDVEEHASEEFVRLERHDLHAVVIGVVPPPESDATVGVIHEAIIRQRDTMRGPAEVVEHLRGAGERPLRIDHPRCSAEVRTKAAKPVASASDAVPAAKVRARSLKARRSPARYLPRKTCARAFTGNRKDARPRIHRVRPEAKAPPVTKQCTCRCWLSVCPQV